MILPQYLRNTSPWLSDFSRLFDQTFHRLQGGPQDLRIHESDEAWTLELDLPGLAKDDLDLEVKNDVLRLRMKTDDDNGPTYTLPLGKRVDTTGIEAGLDAGVLSVRLPKAAANTETKRIEIR